jgi:pimeloyl-ACP methyl ester carboxylesterase
MTAEQFVADLDELVDAACKRVGRKTVVIFGHSWGSVLGVLYAARLWTQRTWLNRLEGHLSARGLWDLGRILLGAPELSILELPS